MREVIAEVNRGTRTVNGTAWPIVDQVVRDIVPGSGKKPRWHVVRGLCNGVPGGVDDYRTRAEACTALSISHTKYGAEYDVQGYYAHGWETVTTEPTYARARARLKEYRENEPGTPCKLTRRRTVNLGYSK